MVTVPHKTKLVTGGPELLPDCSNYDRNKYPKGMNTVDTIIARLEDKKIKVLLVKRKYNPFQGMWAIPGGFVDINENEPLDDASVRELEEETGATGIPVQQLHTYGDPGRDPRDRTFTVAYYALVSEDRMSAQKIKAADDAEDIMWADLSELGSLEIAFDHRKILSDFQTVLMKGVQHEPLVFHLVPKLFSWRDVQDAYEAILQRPVNNIRRKVLSRYILKEEGVRNGYLHRPPRIYSYVGEKEGF